MLTQWREIIKSKLSHKNELETWSGHVNIRMDEFTLILSQPEVLAHRGGHLLEFGCGNGLAAVFFSPLFKQITATDIAEVDHKNHAIGLERAKRMIDHFELKNINLEPGTGEELKYSDNSQDIVFSHFVLEHVPDKPRCLNECFRVLKSGGHSVMAVPSFCSSLFYPFSFYSEFMIRVFNRLKKKFFATNSVNSPSGEATQSNLSSPVVKDTASFRRAYPHFPLPEPHGAFQSYYSELMAQRNSVWVKLFSDAGFTEIKVIPLCILPRSLFIALFGGFGLQLYLLLRPIDHFLCKIRWLTPLSQYICIIAKKP